MISLFRRIRQNLIAENKMGKYMKYAVGEIILVVIGILIALQINIWNESQKIDRSIQVHLKVLKDNLNEDSSQLKELLRTSTDNVHYSDTLLKQMKTLLPVNGRTTKYLVKLLLESQFVPNRNAMETISQSNELPYLGKDLQTAILDYYALTSKTNEREFISNTQIQSKYENHINRYYPEVFQRNNQWEFLKALYQDDPRPIIELNHVKFLSDSYLEGMLVSRHFQTKTLRAFYNSLLVSIQNMMELIETEIEKGA